MWSAVSLHSTVLTQQGVGGAGAGKQVVQPSVSQSVQCSNTMLGLSNNNTSPHSLSSSVSVSFSPTDGREEMSTSRNTIQYRHLHNSSQLNNKIKPELYITLYFYVKNHYDNTVTMLIKTQQVFYIDYRSILIPFYISIRLSFVAPTFVISQHSVKFSSLIEIAEEQYYNEDDHSTHGRQ